MMNVLCTGNKNKPKINTIVNNLCSLFQNTDHKLYIDKKIENVVKGKSFDYLNLYKPSKHIDFVVSIGGDGSILSAVRRMGDSQLPIIGIHIGNLGFLNKLNKNDFIKVFKDILSSKKLKYENKILLKASFINNKNVNDTILALNEIYIKQGEISRLLTLDVDINNKYLNTYRCDGLIISTPLGSTAYSLSAGGPIVSYDVDCNIINPVSPHTLSSRPIVINCNNEITIKCPDKSSNIMIFSDGQDSRFIKKNTKILIKNSDISAKFLKLKNDTSYYEKLRSNLGWHN